MLCSNIKKIAEECKHLEKLFLVSNFSLNEYYITAPLLKIEVKNCLLLLFRLDIQDFWGGLNFVPKALPSVSENKDEEILLCEVIKEGVLLALEGLSTEDGKKSHPLSTNFNDFSITVRLHEKCGQLTDSQYFFQE